MRSGTSAVAGGEIVVLPALGIKTKGSRSRRRGLVGEERFEYVACGRSIRTLRTVLYLLVSEYPVRQKQISKLYPDRPLLFWIQFLSGSNLKR